MTESKNLDIIKIWDECLTIFKDIVELEHYIAWFRPIKPVSLNNDVLTIEVPSHFFYEYIEKNYVKLIVKSISRITKIDVKLEYRILVDKSNSKGGGTMLIPNNSYTNLDQQNTIEYKPLITSMNIQNPFTIPGVLKNKIDSQLNPNYTFENFVVGNCNLTGFNAGKKIIKSPGQNIYNPMVIYSQVGLGKTHLIQAIGNEIKKFSPDLNVLYVSCEKFINQFTDHCLKKKQNDFIQFYQYIDVLIIDDIQFLSEADKTQDAFFAIFNHLHQSNKQIILTSDKPPKDIPNIIERLSSRFKWGLTTELTQPNFETKIAILKLKLKLNGAIEVENDVLNYIADNITTNIRDLEGVLISLIADNSANNNNENCIDLAAAKKILNKIVNSKLKELTIDKIQKITCEHFDLKFSKLLDNSRKREVVQARQVSMWLAKKYTNFTLIEIGNHFNKHYSTVIHSIETVDDLILTRHQNFVEIIELLKNKLYV